MTPSGSIAARPSSLGRRLAVLSLCGLAACVNPEVEKLQQAPLAGSSIFQVGGLDANLIQGEKAVEDGLYEEAQVLFARVLDLQPTNRQAKLGLGEVMLGVGRYREAMARFEEASTEPTLQAKTLQGRGLALLALKNRDQACPMLTESVKADPTLWRSWNGLGQCFDTDQKWEEAEEAYRKALALKPGSAAVHNNLGFSYLLQRKPQEAAAEFVIAVKQDPQLEVAKANLRLALAAQGRYDESLLDVPRDEYSRALNNAGFIAMMRGDYVAAEAYLSRAMEASPAFNEVAWRNLNQLEKLKK